MSRVLFALDLHDPSDGERLEILAPLEDRRGNVSPWFLVCQDKADGEAKLVAATEIGPTYQLERRS